MVRVQITAERIAAAGEDRRAWAAPVEDALAALTGVGVSVDGDGDNDNIVTIGTQEDATLVVDLPADINAWLNARWEGRFDDAGSGPLAFTLHLPDWLTGLLRDERPYLSLREAAAMLGVKAATLDERPVDPREVPTLEAALLEQLLIGLLDGTMALDVGNGQTARLVARREWSSNDAEMGSPGRPVMPSATYTFEEWVAILNRGMTQLRDATAALARPAEPEPDVTIGPIGEDATPDAERAESADLDVAWREAEAKLPKTWYISNLRRRRPTGRYSASATLGYSDTGESVSGFGATPAEALLALAERLSGPPWNAG